MRLLILLLLTGCTLTTMTDDVIHECQIDHGDGGDIGGGMGGAGGKAKAVVDTKEAIDAEANGGIYKADKAVIFVKDFFPL